jgi:hypothetical protein
MNILSAIKDPQLFQPFFGTDLTSWRPWSIASRALYGLPIKSEQGRTLIRQCCGRAHTELPPGGFSTALFLTGRRSGKSRIAAAVGAFEALFGNHHLRLAKGETGLVPIINPTKYQSTIVWNYLNTIFDTPLLKPEISYAKDSEKFIILRNGIEIRILVGDIHPLPKFATDALHCGCGDCRFAVFLLFGLSFAAARTKHGFGTEVWEEWEVWEG